MIAVCLFWTMLFDDGRSAITYADPGLTDVKPSGFGGYVCEAPADLIYCFYDGAPWGVQGYWTVKS